MRPTSAVSRTFFARSNDLRCRDWAPRLSRFVRARLRNLAGSMILFADDPRVWTAWRRGWDPSHYLHLLRWRDEGFQPRIIYDIGAHVGKWSAMAEAIFAPARTFLFEPQADLAKRIVSEQPPGADWTVLAVALGEEEMTRAMHVTENTAASSLLAPMAAGVSPAWGTAPVRTAEVKVTPLDRLAEQQSIPVPDLVKIDVQGYERAVLLGGRQTLAQADRLCIEVSLQPIYRGQALLPEVVAMLSGWGFSIEDMTESCRAWPGPVSQVDLWLKRNG